MLVDVLDVCTLSMNPRFNWSAMIASYVDSRYGVWDSLRSSDLVLFREMLKLVGSGGCCSFHGSLAMYDPSGHQEIEVEE